MYGPTDAWMAAPGEIALKSVVVLAVAWIAAWILRRNSAAVRHVVWTVAAGSLLALPLLVAMLPALRVPVNPVLADPGLVFRAAGSMGGDAVGRTGSTGVERARGGSPATSTMNWPLWLTLVWSAGVAFGMLRMAAAWIRIWRLRQRSAALDDGEIRSLRRMLGIRQAVEVLGTNEPVMPMVCGMLRPAILLPAEAADWSAERRSVVLLHELAHVRRGDLMTHVMARVALHLYWWNPLAWVAWREFLRERERAADDLVLAAGTNGPEYAGHLLEIARTMQAGPAMAVAMARKSELEGRMVAILDSKLKRDGAGAVAVMAALAVAVCVSAPLAALRAQEKSVVAGEAQPQSGPQFLSRGQMLRREGKREAAEEAFRKALELAGDKPAAVEPLTALGTMAFIRKDLEAAEQYLDKALLLDPAKAGTAMMWMAMVRQRQERLKEAESLFQSALAIQDAESAEAATTLELYANMLKTAGREDEAQVTKGRAEAIRKKVEPQVYAAAPKPDVFKTGGGVEPPQLLSKVEPVYTDEARAAHYEGRVVLSAEIHPDGQAHNIRVLYGLGLGLNAQAVEAVKQWKFKPGTKGGEVVTVAATIEVNWRLL